MVQLQMKRSKIFAWPDLV